MVFASELNDGYTGRRGLSEHCGFGSGNRKNGDQLTNSDNCPYFS